jgi:hypothetical protein
MIAAVAALAIVGAVAEPELNPGTFRHWHEYVAPSAAELKFEDVSWIPVMWDAVLEAQKRDRPILLWAMNGHPMACT